MFAVLLDDLRNLFRADMRAILERNLETLVQLPLVGHVLVEPTLHQAACADLKQQIV